MYTLTDEVQCRHEGHLRATQTCVRIMVYTNMVDIYGIYGIYICVVHLGATQTCVRMCVCTCVYRSPYPDRAAPWLSGGI